MGRFYRTAEGEELPGAGILDLHTAHPGPQAQRFIGNVVVEWNGATLVGFENHGGRTYLGAGVQPLGRVVAGFGNNGEDGGEGAVYRKNVFGTYLHGSLLPEEPAVRRPRNRDGAPANAQRLPSERDRRRDRGRRARRGSAARNAAKYHRVGGSPT